MNTTTPQEPAPPHSLPEWDECAMRVGNSDFIAKRVAEGGYGAEPDSKLATQLHRFIHEYDDADPYRSAWFLHRLELLVNECRATARAQALEEAAEVCEDEELGFRESASGASDGRYDWKADGAGDCAAAIRELAKMD